MRVMHKKYNKSDINNTLKNYLIFYLKFNKLITFFNTYIKILNYHIFWNDGSMR